MRAKVVWFILVLWFSCLLVLFFIVTARSEQITLEWDKVDGVDGYYIYQTIRAWNPETQQVEHHFDYSDPIKTESYPDGKIPQSITTLEVDLPGVADADTKYMFTARSFRDDDTSANSNEVPYVVSLVVPPPAAELSGSYSEDEKLIRISWDQPAENEPWRTINHWIIYYRIDDSEWIALGRINADHELSMQAPFNVVPQGEKKEVEFTIVSYRRSGVYSANSEILSIDVDRRGDVPPIENLRINIEFPVI